jgi:hypothetical protein
LVQTPFRLFPRRRSIDPLQVSDKRLAVLPGDVFQAAANLVDDTALYLGLWEYGGNGLAEAVQPVDAGQEDIHDAPVL